MTGMRSGAGPGTLRKLGAGDAQVPADELADEAGAVVAACFRGGFERCPQFVLKPDAPVGGLLPRRLVRHAREAYGLYVRCPHIFAFHIADLPLHCTSTVCTVNHVTTAVSNLPATGKRADIDPFTRMATGLDDDASDAAFGVTGHLDALAVQRARLHKIAVEETSPDRPRYGIGAVDEEDMF